MITLSYTTSAVPTAAPTVDGAVVIEYAALKAEKGWVAVIRRPGTAWHRMSVRPLSAEEALTVARSYAEADAAHYAGDWEITLISLGSVVS